MYKNNLKSIAIKELQHVKPQMDIRYCPANPSFHLAASAIHFLIPAGPSSGRTAAGETADR
ncbi:hypothetical protein D3C71_2091540 [compost metagenome]